MYVKKNQQKYGGKRPAVGRFDNFQTSPKKITNYLIYGKDKHPLANLNKLVRLDRLGEAIHTSFGSARRRSHGTQLCSFFVFSHFLQFDFKSLS